MSEKPTGIPISHTVCFQEWDRRDVFAAAALTGLIANDKLIKTAINQAVEAKTTPEAIIAERCYKFADAMELQRTKARTTR